MEYQLLNKITIIEFVKMLPCLALSYLQSKVKVEIKNKIKIKNRLHDRVQRYCNTRLRRHATTCRCAKKERDTQIEGMN